MNVFTGLEDANQLAIMLDEALDYIAQFAAGIRDITAGGTGANTAAGALTNLGAAKQTDMTAAQTAITALQTKTASARAVGAVGNGSAGSNDIKLLWSGGRIVLVVDATNVGGVATLDDINAVNGNLAAKRNANDGNFGDVPILTPSGRANPVTNGYVAAYINQDGRIGASASSERYKTDINTWDTAAALKAIYALRLVTFRYKEHVELDGDGAPIEHGVIAEELIAAGLDWLVFYDELGQPQGVHYDKLALLAIAAYQDIDARLRKLEGAAQ
jgi:hypothetical protein